MCNNNDQWDGEKESSEGANLTRYKGDRPRPKIEARRRRFKTNMNDRAFASAHGKNLLCNRGDYDLRRIALPYFAESAIGEEEEEPAGHSRRITFYGKSDQAMPAAATTAARPT